MGGVSKPYDATLNALIDARPDDWAAWLAARVGLPPGPAAVIDTDLSVTAQSDKAFYLSGPPPAVIHVELEADSRPGVPARLLRYNVLLGHNRPEPVHTLLVLLRPEANASDITGVYTRAGHDGRAYMEFRYTVVRVWRESVEGLLAGGPGLAPLALVTDEAVADLPGTVARFAGRLRRPDVPGKVIEDLVGTGFVLSGLRHNPDAVAELLRRASMTFEGTAAYQWILEKGVAQGEARGEAQATRRLLLLQGRKRFGPSPAADTTLSAVTDTARLERMAERILDATSWDDLLATP